MALFCASTFVSTAAFGDWKYALCDCRKERYREAIPMTIQYVFFHHKNKLSMQSVRLSARGKSVNLCYRGERFVWVGVDFLLKFKN